MYNYAGVVVESESIQLDRLFTYRIPENIKEIVDVGFRVKIPFGKTNKVINGFIFELYEEFKEEYPVKEIISIPDKIPVLNKNYINIIRYMKMEYLCTYFEAIKVFISKSLLKNKGYKHKNVISIADIPYGRNSSKYQNIYNIIKQNNGIYTKKEISEIFNVSQSSIETMVKHNFLTTKDTIVNRYNDKDYESYGQFILNDKQKNIVDNILYSNKNLFLLHGVTGSGKTEIYMNLVQKMLKLNKDSIILVPEISLTPQMIERFKGRFGKNIAVFHSRLSDGERFDEWMRVKRGEVKVAIGARSAIFLPFNNLGLIVIDEEHENSYKSESDPKYDTRDIARIRSKQEDCKVILGSATPSIDTYYKCKSGEIELLEIANRADGAKMPEIEVVDMRNELINNNKSIFSRKLYDCIKETLDKKQQIILFLNRRGHSSFVSCRKCGYVFKCDRCDISMTYHSNSNYLICHYCGAKKMVPHVCPKCKSNYVKYFGIGTEKLQQEVQKNFPQARVLRMDYDTTRSKNSYEDIYNSFKNGNADILIGTQMIAKGLDFKNVTLVGIIAADLSLNFPDFRAPERTYQIVTQVAGRAGRGKLKGKVIVQTYNPDDPSIRCAVNNDYAGFYKNEISMRKIMNYPPFSKILLINLSSKNEELLIKNIHYLINFIKKLSEENDKIDVLGPSVAGISKIKEWYRWQITIKGELSLEYINKVKSTVYECTKNVYNDIRVSLDVNPINLL